MANWKQTLDASEKSYVIHHNGYNHVDASIGTSRTSQDTFYNYIDAVDGDSDELELPPLTEEQVTERLASNNIDVENGWN